MTHEGNHWPARAADAFRGSCLTRRDTILMTMHGPRLGEQLDPLGVAQYLLEETGTRWERKTHERVRLYATRGSRASQQLDSLRRAAADALFEIALLMQLPAVYTEPVDLFFVDSRAEIQRLVGTSVAGYSDPVSRAAILVMDSTGHSPVRHELAHVVSWRTWGPPGPLNDWMQEGFAVFFDWRNCTADDLHQIAGYLDRQGQLLTIDALIRGFRDFDNATTYLQSGSLVHFAFERYGLMLFRDLWHRGMDNFTYVTKRSLAQLDEAWRAWIRQRARQPSVNWRLLADSGCR